MRNGQNKRMRGRNRKGGHHHQNPLSRVYESNGQDVKIRGTASHIAEKYLQLARDAQSSGDPIAAENYYQHAEHYFRLIAAAQEQLRQSQPYFQQQPGGSTADDGYDDSDEQPQIGEPYAPQQPFYQREPQHNQPQHNQPQQHQPQQHQPQHNQPQHYQQQPQQPQPQHFQPRPQQHAPQDSEADVDRLPSFITGGQSQPQQASQHTERGNGQNGQNGYDGSADRFPLHRRRRRHRSGPRDYAAEQSGGAENDGPAQAGPDSADE
jgi:hypothetical protein